MGAEEAFGRLFLCHSKWVGDKELGHGLAGRRKGTAESFLTAAGLAGGPGGGRLHWRALQHHLGPPPHPSALGVEPVHLLEHEVALEGDRGPPGSACHRG